MESRRQPDDEDDDFCLADGLVDASDQEIERMAEEDAEADVASSAYEGIPLDKGGATHRVDRVLQEVARGVAYPAKRTDDRATDGGRQSIAHWPVKRKIPAGAQRRGLSPRLPMHQ